MRNTSVVIGLLLLATSVSGLRAEIVTKMESRPGPAMSEVPTVVPTTRDRIMSYPAAIVQLPIVAASEKAAIAAMEGNQVGFGRDVIQPPMEAVPDAVRLTATSIGARFIRVAVVINGRGSFRITAISPSTDDQPVALEVTLSRASDPIWTPITAGDTQDVFVERIDSEAPFTVRATRLSHMSRFGAESATAEASKDFGDSASCQIDFKCIYDVAPQEMRPTILAKRDSVALMFSTTQGGSTYTCTGTLLNSANYPLPFLLTAAHCAPDANSVASLTTFWFYHRDVCGSGSYSPSLKQLAGGATTISIVPALEAALLGLNQYPPQGARYSGWDKSAVASGELVLAVHHPSGDALKGSLGTVLGTYPAPATFNGNPIQFAANTFNVVQWQAGIVEPGSSGSSVFTFNPTTATFYARGTLTGGSATCNSGTPSTYYSRLDLFYPYVSGPLSIPVMAATTSAVEYYHAGFGHYFVTAQTDEISGLDGGAFGGAWQRTGQTWNVWTIGTGKADVCRFFTTAFAPKSSHFYTANAAECALVKNNPAWTYEKLAFIVALPVNGICASGSTPLYRLYNNGVTGAPNHRYTTNTTVLNQMIQAGFVQELDNTVCVPN